jgi:hypothetical protein
MSYSQQHDQGRRDVSQSTDVADAEATATQVK